MFAPSPSPENGPRRNALSSEAVLRDQATRRLISEDYSQPKFPLLEGSQLVGFDDKERFVVPSMFRLGLPVGSHVYVVPFPEERSFLLFPQGLYEELLAEVRDRARLDSTPAPNPDLPLVRLMFSNRDPITIDGNGRVRLSRASIAAVGVYPLEGALVQGHGNHLQIRPTTIMAPLPPEGTF